MAFRQPLRSPTSFRSQQIRKMEQPDPSTWVIDQVVDQLCNPTSQTRVYLNIKPVIDKDDALAPALRSNDIDGEALLSLEDVNVKEDLGINSFGQRREIRKIVHHLRSISTIYQAEAQPETKQESTPQPKTRLYSEREESVSEVPNSTPSVEPEPKKRRIVPQLISTEPVNAPDDFDPDQLSPQWLDFLDRHQEYEDEEVLRPYNESDAELALDSDDSLNDELESDPFTPEEQYEGRLSQREVDRAIDEAIAEYREAWKATKEPKKHKAAYRRWMRAAKAGTRKPQQFDLQRQLERYRYRLAKLRATLSDRSMEHHKIEDVKRLCANLHATVDDITESEYYLEVLSSNAAPVMSTPSATTPQPEEVLQEGEEILASSESSEEEEEEDEEDPRQDEDRPMSWVSDAESGLTLDYDPADDDWRPQLPQTSTLPSSEHKLDDFMVVDGDPVPTPDNIGPVHPSPAAAPLRFEGYPLVPPSQPLPIPGSFPQSLSNDLYQLPTLANWASTTPMQISQPNTPQKERYSTIEPHSPYQEIMPPQPTTNSEDVDSDLDLPRLPQSRYRQQGGTLTDAIVLGSSPSGSEHSFMSGMRTPPLNPTTPVRAKQPAQSEYSFPNIQETRAKQWIDVHDPFEALCKIVYRHPRPDAEKVLDFVKQYQKHELAGLLKYHIGEMQDADSDDDDELDEQPEYLWVFFYMVYACNEGARNVHDYAEQHYDMAFEMADRKAAKFDEILRPLLRHYVDSDTNMQDSKKQTFDYSQQLPQSRRNQRDLLAFPGPSTSLPRGYHRDPSMSPTDTETEPEQDNHISPFKKRKRPVEQSQEALSQQKDDQFRVQSQEARRQELMQRLQGTGGAGQVRQIPVSTEDPIVYLDPHIAQRIKEHQIEGIQFIWRELITAPKHQGCLLAHTMGLGKTMQVISFLVTLAQTNRAYTGHPNNPIPMHLRKKKILVLCPASLVDNWNDELLMWTPPTDLDLLGSVYRVSGLRSQKFRAVQEWDRSSGILIVSYESLKALLKTRKNGTEEESQLMERLLLEEPAIVIADEAHKLKNAKSAANNVARRFRTTSRIALTGSPLNNHLEEYHTMIDWIAPGYLGSMPQFRDKYSEPIQRGLYAEASKHDKRTSVRKLYVLKRDLAPKIDRKDISAIAKDMPQKTEFFITVPLTELQHELYGLVVDHILKGVGGSSKSSNAQLWTWIAILSLLCNHPSCLIRKLQEKNPDAVAEAFVEEDDEGLPAEVDLSATGIEALLPKFLNILQSHGSLNQIDDPSFSTRAQVTQQLVHQSVAQGEKILIFSHSIPTLNFLERMLEDMGVSHLRIDGSTKVEARQNATRYFNETDHYMAFLISTRAGGLGLNLQGANRVIIYDFGFNPSWEEQAIGRAYRLGQKKPVFVYRFRAGGTFEEAMYNKSIFKTQLFSRVVDQKNVIRHASKKIEDYIYAPKEPDFEYEALKECSGKDILLDEVMRRHEGAIRNLILTETFQREDEDDVLDDKEQKELEDEVELEQLRRTNITEYNAKLAEREREAAAKRARNPPIVPIHTNQLLNGYGTNMTRFEDVWNPQTLNPPGLGNITRDLAVVRANIAQNGPNAEFMVRSESNGPSSLAVVSDQGGARSDPGFEQQ